MVVFVEAAGTIVIVGHLLLSRSFWKFPPACLRPAWRAEGRIRTLGRTLIALRGLEGARKLGRRLGGGGEGGRR